ncbi:MAG: hypothetical protein ABIL58_22925 [Pseudomonadota bacterium]
MPRTYLVGGTVRDLLLGRPAADHDIATGLDPAGLAAEMARRTGGRVVVFKKADFAVYRVVSPQDGVFDISAIYGQSLETDLGNRDFTINAMALEPVAGRIIDPLGGEKDLRAGRIHIASPRVFAKDPARLLRAFRLSAEFDFALSSATREAVLSHAARIVDVPGERIRQELLKLLKTPRAAERLQSMAETGLLEHLIPQWREMAGCQVSQQSTTSASALALDTVAALESGDLTIALGPYPEAGPPDPPAGLIKLGALLADIGRPAVRRLKKIGRWDDPAVVPRTLIAADALMHRFRLSRRERAVVDVLIKTLHRPSALAAAERAGKPSALAATRFFMAAGDLVPAALALALARRRCLARDTDSFETCLRSLLNTYETGYRIRLRQPPLLSGNRLLAALDLPPGPAVGRLLSILRRHQLAGAIASPEAALSMARSICDTPLIQNAPVTQ